MIAPKIMVIAGVVAIAISPERAHMFLWCFVDMRLRRLRSRTLVGATGRKRAEEDNEYRLNLRESGAEPMQPVGSAGR